MIICYQNNIENKVGHTALAAPPAQAQYRKFKGSTSCSAEQIWKYDHSSCLQRTSLH